MIINFPINGLKKEKIPIEEIRMEIRKIEEYFYGTLANLQSVKNLNNILSNNVNKPYGLIIKAELIGKNIKLFGYNDDSKAVLDPNCNIKYISKMRIVRR